MAGTPFGNLIIELGLNSANFDDGITRAKRQLNTLNKAIRGAGEEVKTYGKGSEAATRQLQLMAQAYKGNEQVLDQYRKRLIETHAKLEENNRNLGDNNKKVEENKRLLTQAKQKQEEYTKAVEKVKSAIDTEKGATKEQAAALKEAEKALAGCNEEVSKHAAELKLAEAAVEGNVAAEKKYKDTIEKTKSSMVSISGDMAKLRNDYKEVAREQALANNKLFQKGNSWTELGKTATESGNKILNVSRAFAPLSAVIGASVGGGLGLAIKAATEYESAVTGVKKTTDPTIQQLKQFEQGFRDLSKEIPVSAAALADMGAVAGQLGIHNESLLSFVETMAKLQTATNIVGEEGAADLAKFMNIMGTSQDDVSRLGSTLVELGNNFATTEKDILAMGMNLAGAGKQLGLSEADVFGIATALSSVGIEAEKGGSAFSKVMINMAQAVNSMDMSAGSKLREFAGVSGMAAEEFVDLFNSNPGQAIAAFVEGLGTANERGYTTLDILQEMKIKEVRLRDTLLRAGGAHKLFNDAMEKGNKAFKENTALQREFNTFSDTTASKWELFKNKLSDVAIHIGEKLLPSVQNILDNAGPFIDGIKNMVDGFSNLPGPVKTAAGALTALGFAFSPIAGFIGQLKLFKGLVFETLGGFAKSKGMAQVAKQSFDIVGSSIGTATGAVGEMAAGAAGASGAIEGIGTAASSSTGLLGGLISVPVLGWIVGITAALGIGYAAWKVWGEKAWNAAQEQKRHKETVEQWGVDVGETMDKALEKTENYATQSQIYLQKGFKVTDETKEKFSSSQKEMFDTMRQAVDDKMEEIKKIYDKLPQHAKEQATAEFEVRQQKAQEAKETIDKNEQEINEIYAKASQERRELTQEELSTITQLRTQAQAELAKVIGKNDSEAQKILDNLTTNVSKMTEQQLAEQQKNFSDMRKQSKEHYEAEQQNLQNALNNGILTWSQYQNQLKESEKAHNSELQNISLAQWANWKEQIKRYREGGQEDLAQMLEETARNGLKQYGTSIEEMDKLLEKQQQNAERRAKYIKDSVKDLTGAMKEEVVKANAAWETLITDEKTGEIKGNLRGVLATAMETSEGWNNIEFILKNATLNSNSKAVIKQALTDKDYWNYLTFDMKKMLVDDESLTEAQKKAIELHNLWENQEFLDKLIRIDTTAPDATEKITELLKEYGITTETIEKPLTVKTETNAPETTEKVDGLKKSVELAQGLTSKGANLKTSTNAPESKTKIEDLTKSINQVPTSTHTTATVDTSNAERKIGGLQSLLATIGGRLNAVSRKAAPLAATGRNFFDGGLVYLGDGKRREPFLTPNGMFGVSPATDTLYALPRGTKIWPSISHFKQDARNDSRLQPYMDSIPRYATGTRDSFLNTRLPNVFNRPREIYPNEHNTEYADNSVYSPTLHIEHFHADKGQDEEALFKKFAWLIKREGDRM